jgi:hypothetical protein
MASIAISRLIFARRPAMAAFVIVVTGWITGKRGPEGPIQQEIA